MELPKTRLTDRRTAEAVRANAEKLQAAGFEVSISDLRYVKLAEYENKEENRMFINGKWYTEPELEAYVNGLIKQCTELKQKNKELEEKHWGECRQISEYDIATKKLEEYEK